MLMFLLGAVCGVILAVFLTNAKQENNKNDKDAIKTEIQKAQSATGVNINGDKIVPLNIPVSALSNLYSLSVENYTVKHAKKTYGNGKTFEYISIDCELHYKLNGRKEGKRYFVFSYYDQQGNVISHSQTNACCLTEAGVEIVHQEHHVAWDNIPKRIGISIEEAF